MHKLDLLKHYVLQDNERLLLIGSSLFILLLAYFSPVSSSSSDPHFSLIVSQSLLQKGTIKLDAYQETHPQLFEAFNYQVDRHENGHYYYNYPIGPSLLAAPFVWLAQIAGLDMLVIRDNHAVQNLLSAVLCALIFIVIYLTSRNYLPALSSLTITTVSFLGSSLISTIGTALWNIGFAVLFILLSLLLIGRYDSGRTKNINTYFLGFFLFASYYCRPSSAIFILIVFTYLFFKDKRILIKTAGIASALLLLSLLSSRLEYGQWFSLYYSASFWYETSDIWKPLFGLLFSPSRGLFIFSPFLLLVPVIGLRYYRYLKESTLFWLCLVWISFQVLAISTTRNWWGGFSYGSRLLTDAIPALIMMTILLWHYVAPNISRQTKRIAVTGYLTLGIIAVFINSFQGLFNIKTTLWNAYPNIDENQDYLFDWKYPQFLTTTEAFHTRRFEYYQRALENGETQLTRYTIGDTLTPTNDGKNAIFIGWWENNWTETISPKVLFTLEEIEQSRQYTLEISSGAHNNQEVNVTINNNEIGSMIFPGPPTTNNLDINGKVLKPGGINEIEFTIPDASYPNFEEIRQLGLRFAPHRLGLVSTRIRILLKE